MSAKASLDLPIPSEVPIWYAPEFQAEDLEVRPPHLGRIYLIKACKTFDPTASLILIDEEGRYRANIDAEEEDSAILHLVLAAGSQLLVRCTEIDGYFGTARVESVGDKGSPCAAARNRVPKGGWFTRRKTRSGRRP